MRNLFILLLSIFYYSYLSSQEYQLFAGSVPKESAIELKWFSKSIGLDASFDIYRTETGQTNWNKINTSLIKRRIPLTESELEKEANLQNSNRSIIAYSLAFLDEPTEFKNNLAMLHINSISDNILAEYCGIYLKDMTITSTQSYDYKLVSSGSETILANISKVKYSSDYRPELVSGFQGKSGNKIAVFNWNYRSEYPMYKIYKGSGPKNYDTSFVILPVKSEIEKSNSNKLFYQDKLADNQLGKTNHYSIVAVDYFGRESIKSTDLKIDILDLSPPPAIMGFRAIWQKDQSIILHWRKSQNPIKQLKLWKSTNRTAKFELIITIQDTSYIDKIIIEGQSHYYFLEAISENNISSFTDTIQVTAPDLKPPSIPQNFVARSDTGRIYLRWTANKETDLLGYYIFRALSADDQNYHPLFIEPISGNQYTDNLPSEASNQFVYKICAVDKFYNKSEVSSPILIAMPDKTPPIASELIEINELENQVKLEWTTSLDFDFMNYEVYKAEANNDTSNGSYRLLTSLTQTSYIDKSIEPSKSYSYYIRTIDSSLNYSSSRSREIVCLDKNTQKIIQKIQVNPRESSIHISWQGNGSKVVLMKREETGQYYSITPPAIIEAYEDKQVEKSKIYFYKLRIIGGEENKESEEIRVEF